MKCWSSNFLFIRKKIIFDDSRHLSNFMNRICNENDDENIRDNNGTLKLECTELHVLDKGLVNKIFWSLKCFSV